MKKWMVMILTACLALPVMAQEDDLRNLPGFVDFGELNNIYGEPKVQISLAGAVLGFVSALSSHEDPEAAELFDRLKGVRVNVYNTAGESEAAFNQISRVSGMLADSAWSPIVRVNEEGEQVQIFLKLNGETVEGFTLMAVDSEEAVFINIIGNIDPNELAKVMDDLDVDIDGLDIDVN